MPEDLITIKEYCVSYNAEESFVSELASNGLIGLTTVEQTVYISAEQLTALEKFTRFHYDLDINVEGIEVIHHLLTRMEAMHHEMSRLKTLLSLHEPLI